MADAMADYMVSQQKLAAKIAAQEHAVLQNKLSIMELADVRRRHLENIELTLIAIKEGEEALGDRESGGGVERLRIIAQVAAQKSTVAQQELAIAEMVGRALKHDEAIESSARAIDDFREQLAGLEQEHGKLTEETFITMRESLSAKE